jgi:uncharacterized protein (UPF0297 family)
VKQKYAIVEHVWALEPEEQLMAELIYAWCDDECSAFADADHECSDDSHSVAKEAYEVFKTHFYNAVAKRLGLVLSDDWSTDSYPIDAFMIDDDAKNLIGYRVEKVDDEEEEEQEAESEEPEPSQSENEENLVPMRMRKEKKKGWFSWW